jgi:cytochrome c biogenesis protein
MDSNLPLKFAEWQGRLAIEKRDLPTNQIPAISRLPVGPQAFRGSIHIPEGKSSEVAFVGMRDGYLVQELPFKLQVKDFRIEHYATGQPKSFETDLVVFDADLAEPLEQTISVNHPLLYKGYAIYQASFSDGGSELSLEAWPLTKAAGKETVEFDGKVFENREMKWGDQSLKLELLSFRPFNINPDPTEDDPERIRNFGPSFGFKLRTKTGEALEYINYMLPVEKDGRSFLLSGVRSSPADEFGYLYLPVDKKGGLDEFSQFLGHLYDKEKVYAIAHNMMLETLTELPNRTEELEQNLEQTLVTLVAMFIEGGFQEVGRFIDTAVPENERENLGPAYISMLREMLARIYFGSQNINEAEQVNGDHLMFLQDAVDAIGSLPRYGSPVYLMLTDYQHVEASGLQIARSPGKPVVYLGCALLTIGVFILFYLPQRRFWMLVKTQQQQTTVLLAGMSNRNPREFDVFFEQQKQQLQSNSGNS